MDTRTKPLGLHLPEDLHRDLKVFAAERGTTMSALLERSVKQLLRRHGAFSDNEQEQDQSD